MAARCHGAVGGLNGLALWCLLAHNVNCESYVRKKSAMRSVYSTLLLRVPSAPLPAAPVQFRVQEISTQLTVGYATRLIDMNDDQRPDIVVVDTERVIWFENPTWQMHTLIQNQTK